MKRSWDDQPGAPPEPSQGSLVRPMSAAQPTWLCKVARTPAVPGLWVLSRGERLHHGRYVVREQLGRGGLGVVYLAHDNERDELVALKTLREVEADAILNIKQEFRSLTNLVHENIVLLHELFEDQGRFCFTMEYVRGSSLLTALRQSARRSGAVEQLLTSAFAELARGTCAIHGAGKVHRDLKPSNVMMSEVGRVVILDFGLASNTRQVDSDVYASAIAGTPDYMSPEQSLGFVATPASDWYAVGVMLFEALTGRLPFVGEQRFFEKQRYAAPRPSELAPGVSPRLDALCAALLEQRPERRPTGHDVLRELSGQAEAWVPVPHPQSADGPLLGREAELSHLRAALGLVERQRRPVVALVSGDSGIGKSSLCRAFMEEATGRTELVLTGRCYERESVPFKALDAVIDELTRRLLGLESAVLEALLPEDAWALARLFPTLRQVRVIAQQPAPHLEDLFELRRRGFSALAELLRCWSQGRPLVVSIDDLQWTDGDSLLLLLHLLREAEPLPLLLVGAHRGSPGNAGQVETLYQALYADLQVTLRQIPLGPLPDDAVRQLVERTGHSPELQALGASAGGNPFLLQQLLHYRDGLEDAGALDVSKAIRFRLGRLPEPQRVAIEVLALAGTPLPGQLLLRAARLSVSARGVIESLCAEQLVMRSRDERQLEIYHDRIRETLVLALEPARAQSHHRGLARELAEHSEADPEQVALHFESADEPRLAAPYLKLAAERALTALAFDHAAALYQRALESGGFSDSERRSLQLARGKALAYAGRGLQSAEAYLAGIAGKEDAECVPQLFEAAEQTLRSGDQQAGLGLLRRALSPVGVRIFEAPLATVLSLGWQLVQLKFRGRGFQARSTSEPIERRIEMMLRAGEALALLDGVRSVELSMRALLLSLRHGYARGVSFGLTSELWMALLFGASDERLQVLTERAERAVARSGGVLERASLHYVRASVAHLKPKPDFPTTLREIDAFLAIHREHVQSNSSYMCTWAEANRVTALTQMGRLAEAGRSVPGHLAAGWARGDMTAVPTWAGGYPAVSRLALADVEALDKDLREARQAWQPPNFTFQDLALSAGASLLLAYQGRSREMVERAERDWTLLRDSPLRHARLAIDHLQSFRARAAVALARDQVNPTERANLLAHAERIGRGRAGKDIHGALRSICVLAAVECQRGHGARAVRALEQAQERTRYIPLYHHCVKRRLGELLGGERGAALVADADRFFEAGGVKDSDRFVEALLPGCVLFRTRKSAIRP